MDELLGKIYLFIVRILTEMHGSRRDNNYFIRDGDRYYLVKTDEGDILEIELIRVDRFRDEVETAMLNKENSNYDYFDEGEVPEFLKEKIKDNY